MEPERERSSPGKTRIMQGDKHEAALLLKKAGWSDRRIGIALSVSTNTVKAWRAEHQISAAHSHHPRKKLDEARALAMYEEGATDGDIAREFNVNQSGVSRWLRRIGLEPNGKFCNRFSQAERRQIKERLKAGWSCAQVLEVAERGSLTTIRTLRREIKDHPGVRGPGQTVTGDRAKIRKVDQRKLMARIKRAVGTGLSCDIAEEAASAMMLELYLGHLKPSDIELRARTFKNQTLDKFASRKYRSLDRADPETGLSMLDLIVDDDAQTDIEEAAARAFAESIFASAE